MAVTLYLLFAEWLKHASDNAPRVMMRRGDGRLPEVGRLGRTVVAMSGACVVLLALPARGQGTRTPILDLDAPEAVSSTRFGSIVAVREVHDRHLLVNDVAARKVLLLDQRLAELRVVADTTARTGRMYGARGMAMIAYRGDSTLLADIGSLWMVVLDGQGTPGRTIAIPATRDLAALAGGPFGVPAFDDVGRLVYRAPPRGIRPANGMSATSFVAQPDSAPISRIELSSRKLDTVGFLKVPSVKSRQAVDSSGQPVIVREINPLPVIDGWTVLADGSVGIVRGQDYHIDWIASNGVRSSTAKLPFPWRRLSDSDKVHFIDSLKARRARAQAGADSAARAITRTGSGTRSSTNVPGATSEQTSYVQPEELPDYWPAFFSGAVRSDADNNIWVYTTLQGSDGSHIYDVISRQGLLIGRVRVAPDRTIVGFGPQGGIYLALRDDSGVRLARVSFRALHTAHD